MACDLVRLNVELLSSELSDADAAVSLVRPKPVLASGLRGSPSKSTAELVGRLRSLTDGTDDSARGIVNSKVVGVGESSGTACFLASGASAGSNKLDAGRFGRSPDPLPPVRTLLLIARPDALRAGGCSVKVPTREQRNAACCRLSSVSSDEWREGSRGKQQPEGPSAV